MKNKSLLLLLVCLSLCAGLRAQTSREDKDEKTQARAARIKDKSDYALFHRQMLSLKEYGEERKKIPALQKANKTTVKITAVIDSANDEEGAKTLTGYIVQNIGDNSVNVYEVIYDRTEKKIALVKKTTEGTAADKEEKEEKADRADEKKAEKKTTTTKKKSKDDDDDDDDDKPEKDTKDKD